jgi:hypothetical protein
MFSQCSLFGKDDHMQIRRIHFVIVTLLLTVLFGGKLQAQISHPLDLAYSQLRGTWEYHTYDDKWTLQFDCDHKLLFDREPHDYTLTDSTIRIQDDQETTDYPYTLTASGLVLTLPDGSERKYKRTDPGSSEQLVSGKFYGPGAASANRPSIAFDGDHSFVAYVPSSGKTVEKHGVYRVEGEVIVLSLNDQLSYEAGVRLRDEDSAAVGIMIQGTQFQIDRPVAANQPEQHQSSPVTITNVAGSSQPAPQPEIVPDYSAGPAPAITSLPSASTAATAAPKAAPAPKPQSRQAGNSRGKPDHE